MKAGIVEIAGMFPRRLAGDLLALTALCWAGFVIVVGGIEIAVTIWGSFEQSLWAELAQIPSWFIAFIGGYITYTLLPMYVANGRTRREFAFRAALFLPVYALFSAVLMTSGFLLERVLYSYNDWPQEIRSQHLYTSATEYGLIFTEFLMVYLVWGATGSLVGAAWYRSTGVGVGALFLAAVPLGVTSVAMTAELGPFDWVLDGIRSEQGELPLAVAVPACLAMFAGVLAVTWLAVRDIPLKAKTN